MSLPKSGDSISGIDSTVAREARTEDTQAAMWRDVPDAPGVYLFYDGDNRLLYVGKAKLLRKRVQSYFRENLPSPRTRLMMAKVARLEVTLTRSEAEALLLENNLIKQLGPRYNILFRDDKTYPFIALKGQPFPRLAFHRGVASVGNQLFGPFPNVTAVRESMRFLQKIFQLRTCEDGVFAHRSRPCLLHQIGRCSAPCVGLVDQAAYARAVELASLCLKGKDHEVVEQLDGIMQTASRTQRYEEAAHVRDQIRALRAVVSPQYAVSQRQGNVDVIALSEKNGVWCVNVSMVRGGRHLGDHPTIPHHHEQATIEEVLVAFVEHHYSRFPPPDKILCNMLPEEELTWLSAKLSKPRFEEEKAWMRMAKKNAAFALETRKTATADTERRLVALRQVLGVHNSDPRIECFDVSHSSGEATVASCVVWAHGAMDKGQYRRFHIRNAQSGDDYGALREALQRRYLKAAMGEQPLPDVLFIDGGMGQVKVAAQILQDLGMDGINLVGIAKGEGRKPGLETLITAEGESVNLVADHPALLLIQVLRDEAHRFALVGHRVRQARTRNRSLLEDIPGVGPAKRRALLAHFGGLSILQDASLEDLTRIPGIGRTLATTIHQYLHGEMSEADS